MATLSDLPESVIHQIISHLTTKETVQASVLSKQLLNAVSTRPNLVFDTRLILSEIPKGEVESKKAKRCKQELEYLFSTLVGYPKNDIVLETFTLKTHLSKNKSRSKIYNRCLELSAKIGFRKLDISLHRLPSSIYRVDSLVQCTLDWCGFLKEDSIWWPNLKRLSIRYTSFDQVTFNSIIKGCPLIQFLDINYCCAKLTNFSFKITGSRNLKRLNAHLFCGQSVEVNGAPVLESVAFRGDYSRGGGACCWLNFRETEYQNLQSLCLYDNVGIDGSFSVDWKCKFPHLEHLSIQNCHNIQRISISSWSLKKLQIQRCHNIQRIKLSSSSLEEIQLTNISTLQEAHFDIPSIALFEYENFGFKKSEITPKLSFSGISHGWTSDIKLECESNLNTSWLIGLKEFLTAFNGSEASVTVYFGEDVSPEVVRMNTSVTSIPGGLQEIRNFFIQNLGETFSLSSVRAIVHGIFLICRPRAIAFQHWSDDEYPKLFHDILVLKRDNVLGNTNLLQLANYWYVTGIELFGHNLTHGVHFYYSKKGQGLPLCGPSNCNEFLERLKAHLEQNKVINRIIISINLEWRICETEIQPKRICETEIQPNEEVIRSAKRLKYSLHI